ncbi:hypothetical protein [Planomonospora sp. ID82291]|uniref:hypothetical protein n=1 Tax=Planomonospora sp. ID82291 TaxID=2738136 RepID=UPI0018C3F89D|nr:hypothetical protein [Planomonospora sp. ID82291]MBG0818442.1 hypothetical protein [Planomonospora sp. ID82291]
MLNLFNEVMNFASQPAVMIGGAAAGATVTALTHFVLSRADKAAANGSAPHS